MMQSARRLKRKDCGALTLDRKTFVDDTMVFRSNHWEGPQTGKHQSDAIRRARAPVAESGTVAPCRVEIADGPQVTGHRSLPLARRTILLTSHVTLSITELGGWPVTKYSCRSREPNVWRKLPTRFFVPPD